MSRWLAVVVLATTSAGCVTSNVVACNDDKNTICPNGAVCDLVHGGCISPDQMSTCDGKPDLTACLAHGACHDGVCFPIACGNGFVDPGEICDDGNNADGDTCARDCQSDLTCGNGIIDLSKGETCDDGNRVSHDGCTSTCQTETSHWLQYGAKAGGRSYSVATYDSRRDRVVMFSGSISPVLELSPKTQEWDGTGWTDRVSPSNPAPRYQAAMAFDHARGQAVLFGGNAGSLVSIEMNDTWEWDGVAWKQASVAGPEGRFGHALVYDAARKRTVLFGGQTSSGLHFPETWEYDGKAWTQVATSTAPPVRSSMLAAYDPARGKVVIASGYGSSGQTLDDVWEYDGTWHDVTPPTGLRLQFAGGAMAFDPTLQRVVAFGGYGTSGASNKTYAWNGTSWSDLQIAVAQPDARYDHVFVSAFPHPFLAGGLTQAGQGQTQDDDAYYFTGTTWKAPSIAPAGGYAVVTNLLRRSFLLWNGSATYEALPGGVTKLAGTPPSARGGAVFVADPAHDSVLVFGGALGSGGAGTSETWTLTNSTWSKRTLVAPYPDGRQGASAAFDGARVIIFGGRAADVGAFFGDTWSWDGNQWSPISTATAPGERFFAAMGYDPIRHETILFGGFTYNGDYIYWHDTWAFDGTMWTERHPPTSPSARAAATLTWDPARGHLVLLGGGAADAWEWTGTSWQAIGVSSFPVGAPGAVTASLDGRGLTGFGQLADASVARFELRWDGPGADERCDGTNADGDKPADCADEDCWSICTPLCPPGTSCPSSSTPTCGDGTCSAPREDGHTCPTDCQPVAVCGDFYCDPGETCPGDCPTP